MQLTPGPTAEQGPSIISSIVLDPPGWLIVLFVLASAVVIVQGGRNLRSRDWSLTLDMQREMLTIAGTAALVTLFTLVSLTALEVGYLGDVVVGFLFGWGLVQLLQTNTVQRNLTWERRLRITVGWTGLVAIVVVGFPLVAPNYARALLGLQAMLSLGSAVLVGYNSKVSTSS